MIKTTVTIILLAVFPLCSHAQNGGKVDNDFKLTYLYAALGSGMGSKQPVLRVVGTAYLYTREQNSHYGKQTLSPDTVYSGNLRRSSIDSIVNLISTIEDTSIYNTNTGVRSGGVHELWISSNDQELTFTLHNASNPVAEQIVAILNSNIPLGMPKLWLFGIPDDE